MVKENAVSRPFTRSLASALRASTTQNQQRANTKRPASEDKNVTAPNKKKRRAVLGDISNVTFNAPKLEAKNIKQVKKGRGTSQLASSCVTSEITKLQSKTDAKAEAVSVTAGSMSLCKGTNDTPDIPKFIDIDSDDKDPLLCCLYAPEIYYSLRDKLQKNPTLEHYTTYKASDLKASVYALQDLQLNTKGCPLSAVRMKYKQEKFKFVAVLTSPKLLDTLF
ncbi:hypothetical protein Bca52824_076262 [Brassica carinata]|uniref:Cyclin C-terminal domain-containing protein n=1 Tax=Brassica carinata TaxID=52824 RepID=A0A8X7PUS6_BRACI|nr:hypothetical protein Bca52824_076262 [Brassica carinata]